VFRRVRGPGVLPTPRGGLRGRLRIVAFSRKSKVFAQFGPSPAGPEDILQGKDVRSHFGSSNFGSSLKPLVLRCRLDHSCTFDVFNGSGMLALRGVFLAVCCRAAPVLVWRPYGGSEQQPSGLV
jgi:hypothetical protein